MTPGIYSFKNWLLAIRPKTLWASIAPVLIGTAMAYGDGVHHFPSAFAALLGAFFVQIGTNLANDYFDGKSGVDMPDRLGPVRVTQAGLIPPLAVKWAFIACFLIAGLVASYLVVRAGFPVLIIGILSILSGIFYTAGPKPLSHLGLGDIFVLIFFGPVAVAGTYYVQSFECNGAVIAAGFAPGLFSAAILAVNNLRDIKTDDRAGKKTLAVRFGRTFVRAEYLVCIAAGSFIPALVFLITNEFPKTLVASLVFLLLLPAINTVYTSDNGDELNAALAQTSRVLFIYAVIFSAMWVF
ncbi:MAG: 1,4-dihydroxy-2-naphthoate polyprenyltransferase [Candidatus Omnitrophica bacterium]|nr:1,4-dihydroxy-2-naphthoate polyprenyltransferase [Candidatus Omnitrophota bacterium]